MAVNGSYTNLYDIYANKSFIDRNNFYGQIFPSDMNKLFIPCDKLNDFYSDTIIYLHLYTSLFFELFKYNNTNNNDIAKFSNLIKNLSININNSSLDTDKIASLNETTNTFIFNLDKVASNYNSISYRYYDGINNNEKKLKPILDNIETLTSTSLVFNLALFDFSTTTTMINYNKESIKNEKDIQNNDYMTIYDNKTRKNKLLKVINEILLQIPENIMSYLLYYKIYYHIIIYNVTIQSNIRTNYLNNSNILSISPTSKNSILTSFDNMSTNIDKLNNNYLGFDKNDFINDKYKYTAKITDLNSIRDEYIKIQNSLNNTIKDYNKFSNNFNSIKFYANYIIIFLIIIILFTILITFIPFINSSFKNYYYIITFIIIIIITLLYYNNFKHINLYEKFTMFTKGTGDECTTYVSTFNSKITDHKNSHTQLYNDIRYNMNNYNKKIKDIFDNLRTNIYTIGNKVFVQDANTYLYNLYKEKKNQNEVNRIKKISLTNMIETMKKQVIYLFNIILLINLLIIILLLGLILFTNFPFYLNYIIILCIILITIIIIYFIFSIIQPTRMIANKNYWANKNPSDELLNNL